MNDYPNCVVEFLRDTVGIPVDIRGFNFLCAGVMNVYNHGGGYYTGINHLFYAELHMELRFTTSQIERHIRHAIEIARDRDYIKFENVYKMLGLDELFTESNLLHRVENLDFAVYIEKYLHDKITEELSMNKTEDN